MFSLFPISLMLIAESVIATLPKHKQIPKHIKKNYQDSQRFKPKQITKIQN
jgi:hypothetical protein